MQNINYDLIKLLHSKLDTIWRLEKHYVGDAKKAKCHSRAALEKILTDERAHADMIAKEIQMRMNAKKFY